MSKLTVVQNNKFGVKITVTNRNLSGYTAYFIVKSKKDNLKDDSKALINKSFLLNDVNATNGIIEIALSSVETNIQEDSYKYEILIELNNERETLVKGEFYVTETLKKE